MKNQSVIESIETENSGSKFFFWATIVLVTQIPLVLKTLNAFIPVSYGWFGTWAHAGKQLTPYKDYFIPFPILGVWIEGSLPNLFTHYVFAEQIFAGIFWLLLVLGQFLLTTLIWKPKSAAIGTIFAAYFYFSWPVLKLASYYEVMLLFLIFGVYFTIIGMKEKKASSRFLFFGGIFLAAAPFIKQTAVISSLLIFSFSLYYMCRQVRDKAKVFSFVAGYTTVPLVIFLIAMKGHFLVPMITAMVSGGGKSPTLIQAFNWGVTQPITSAGWWPWFILSGWVFVRIDKSGVAASFRQQILYLSLLTIFFMGIVSPNTLFVGSAPSKILGAFLSLFVASTLIAIVVSHASPSQGVSVRIRNRLINVVNFGLLFCYIIPNLGFVTSRELQNDVSSLAPTISSQLGFGAVIFTIAFCLFSFFVPSTGSTSNNPIIRFTLDAAPPKFSGQLISIFLLTLAVSNSMVAGFTPEAWVVSIGFLIAFISNCIEIDLNLRSSKVLQVGLLLPFLLFFSVRTITEPYFWWSLREPAIEASRHSIPIKSMGGFRVNLNERDQWIRLRKAVSSKPISPIFAGPNIGGIPFMIGREALFNNCPIIWWDVCPENLAAEDLDWLKTSRPEFIMWSHQPAGVIDGHEKAFRGGKISAVSEMQVWIDRQLVEGTYRLVDSIELSPENSILIMLRNIGRIK